MLYEEFLGELAGAAEDGYREFALRGTPTERPLLGVRTGKQRELAKKILSGDVEEFLKHEPVSFEEVNVRGFVIASLPYEEMLKYFDGQVKLIDNWANCDGFAASLKSIKKHREEFLPKIDELIEGEEFTTRTGIVILLSQYLAPEYVEVALERVDRARAREEYYVKMATAWLVAEIYIKFPEAGEAYLRAGRLSKWTQNKAISKICDSLRVGKEEKDALKKLRK